MDKQQVIQDVAKIMESHIQGFYGESKTHIFDIESTLQDEVTTKEIESMKLDEYLTLCNDIYNNVKSLNIQNVKGIVGARRIDDYTTSLQVVYK